ncbi:DUF1353 domain-containing protein [Pseudomonas solani]|uniref:DUF1353 domain-containing protein n=1 Tax=Pseudomonas solani TaxID=2731552 RepID=UPI003D6B0C35
MPRLAWRIVPRDHAQARRPAVVHDYIYTSQTHRFTKEEADRIFQQALIEEGMNRALAWLMWCAVRIGGRGQLGAHLMELLEKIGTLLARAAADRRYRLPGLPVPPGQRGPPRAPGATRGDRTELPAPRRHRPRHGQAGAEPCAPYSTPTFRPSRGTEP